MKNNLAGDFKKYLPSSASTHNNGRIRYLAACVALEFNDFDSVKEIFSVPFEVAEIKEGEAALSDLWLKWKTRELSVTEKVVWNDNYHQQKSRLFAEKVPFWLDFRMAAYIPR